MKLTIPLVVLSFLWANEVPGAMLLAGQGLQQLREAPPGTKTLKIEAFPLEDGRSVELNLTRFQIWKPDARIVVHTPDGDVDGTVPTDAYYRGTVTGDARSFVWLSVGRTTRGLISTEDATYVVGPRKDVYRGTLPDDEIFVRAIPAGVDGAGAPSLFRCGAEGLTSPFAAPPKAALAGPGTLAAWTTTYNIDVAIETDYELYANVFSGNMTNELAYIGDLAAAASVIYLRDIKTTFQIPYVSLWTTSADPWMGWGSGQMINQLAELGDYWHNNRAGVSRTIVHMLSGKALNGGVAWMGVLCGGDFLCSGGNCGDPALDNHYGGAYGVSGSLNGALSTNNLGTYWDLLCFTHEIGHNFNSPHTQCYTPAIDTCCPCAGGTCVGPLPAGGGTIMSYCHLLSGGYGNVNMTFGVNGQLSAAVLTTMRDHIESSSSSCVCQLPDAAVGVSPASGVTGVTTGTLSWTNTLAAPSGSPQTPDSGVTSYDVFFDTVSPPVHRVSFGSVTPSAAIPVWFPNLTYFWQVVSKNGCGSASSPVYSFSTGACPWTGSAPALTSPGAGATGVARKVRLSWGAVAGAGAYWLFLGKTNPPTLQYAVVPSPQTSLTVSLAPGTTYYWSVEAHPGCGNEAPVLSTARSFTTTAAVPPPGPAVAAMNLTSASPTFLNRWAGGSLTAFGTNLNSNNLLFVDLFGRTGGTFTFGSQTAAQVSGTLGADPTAPAGFYDVGLTYWGFENLRLPGALTLRAFTDVTESDFFFLSSSRVVDAGILEADFDSVTAGPQLSPTTVVTRALMARYLARAHEWWRTGSSALPAATCVPSGSGSTDFPDVPCSHPNWLAIHWIKTWGITQGATCPGGVGLCYLPTGSVTRSQMVTFLGRLKYGPEGTGTVLQGLLNGPGQTDPGCGSAWPVCSGWIDPQLQIAGWPHPQVNVAFQDRLTTGCSGTVGNNLNFCSGFVVTRGQISEFLARTVGLAANP